MALLTVDHITYRYPNGVCALSDVSFALEKAERVGLVGANGAGKSTLLSLLCGLYEPEEGQIVVDNVPLQKSTLALVRNMIGMVFQNPDDQLFMPTILEDVRFGLVNRGYTQQEVAQKAQQALEQLGIAHLGSRPPYRLSGGEKRSAALATVLTMEPHLILFDEPTAFLDPRSKRKFIDILRELPAACLVATHDIDLVRAACSRVIVLQDGAIVACDAPERVFADTALLERAGL